MHNADVLVREASRFTGAVETFLLPDWPRQQDITEDDFIDVIDGNRKYCKCSHYAHQTDNMCP